MHESTAWRQWSLSRRGSLTLPAKEAPMTDQNPNETTPPSGDPFTDEPNGDGASSGSNGAASSKGREWLSQLETMINDIATQAAPVARQVAAKAAELTAVAAVKAGPVAHRAADMTTDAGQKLAERAQNLASELRGEAQGTSAEDASWGGDGEPGATPQSTFEDATDSTTDTGTP